MNVCITDIIVAICFLPALIDGLRKGFIRQVFAIAAIFVGFFLAGRFSPDFAAKMSEWFSDADSKVLKIFSFAILLLGGIIVTNLVGMLATSLMKVATLGWVNRLAGMVFGLVKTALLLMLLIYLFDSLNSKWGMVSRDALDKSCVYSYLLDLSVRIFPKLKELIANA